MEISCFPFQMCPSPRGGWGWFRAKALEQTPCVRSLSQGMSRNLEGERSVLGAGGAAIAVDLHAGVLPRHGGHPLWQRQREWGGDAESQDSSGLYFSVFPSCVHGAPGPARSQGSLGRFFPPRSGCARLGPSGLVHAGPRHRSWPLCARAPA